MRKFLCKNLRRTWKRCLKKRKMSLRTYGDKPLSFQLEEGGEYYYVGSEVCLNQSKKIIKPMKKVKKTTNAFRLETIYDSFVGHFTKNILAWQDEH